ncbi:flagellar basal body L-ring protein FlgH [Sulfitobacter sp. R18_1]|nr:flagellar basal body L-ring protein FlgH [Sulfitobacter sp. R18_1]
MKRLVPAIALSAAVSACGMQDIGKEPELSSMVVDKTTAPEASSVQIPMPPQVQKRELQRAEGASLWQTGSGSFFKDQRAGDVGDILTVNIDIQDKATLSNASEAERSSGNQVAFPTFFGYASRIATVLPGIGQDQLPQGDIVDLGSQSSHSGSGSVNRNEKISLKVAALIIDKLPNGTLVIAGRQEVRVNYELRELRVAGIVRPEDITMDNTISYEKIAEARIAYGGRGQISKVQKPQYGKEMVDIILPY